MKRIYHLCFSLENELLCRDEADYYRLFNCYAYALMKTGSVSYADAVMSSHFHAVVCTEEIVKVSKLFKISYGLYFNNKYKRKGRFGRKSSFILEIEGNMHLLAAISYVLRNPLHHGVAASPFGYNHSSVSLIFAQELGFRPLCKKSHDVEQLSKKYGLFSDSNKSNLCQRNWRFPEEVFVTRSGIILRESVTEVKQVEHLYGSVRSYLYYMNRLSGEEWKKEQEMDCEGNHSLKPIGLTEIEVFSDSESIAAMMSNERGRFRPSISDIELCAKVDALIGTLFGNGHTVYTLTHSEKRLIAAQIRSTLYVPQKQLSRCLALKYSDVQSSSEDV